MSFYDHKVNKRRSGVLDLADLRGKVVLVVNTATGCGFTPQYEPLQNIYDEFKDKDFEILDFPCNQFLEQAPGSDEEIHTFCTGRFGITYPQYAKIDVLGENAAPLFKWLSETTTFHGFGEGKMADILKGVVSSMDVNYAQNGNIKWNFTKFLFDREGNFIARFEPTDSMDDVKAAIEKSL